jgi:hypothetical protein
MSFHTQKLPCGCSVYATALLLLASQMMLVICVVPSMSAVIDIPFEANLVLMLAFLCCRLSVLFLVCLLLVTSLL